jgi:hypothetical protein
MKAVSCLLLLTALVLCQGVFGHYVLMREGFRKCYLIEVPKDTLIWGNFQCEPEGLIAGVNPLVERGIGIIVEVVDPIERTVYSRAHDRDSKFAWSAQIGGEHKVCFETNTTSWFAPAQFKFHLEVGSGAQGKDYDEIGRREKLSSIELKVRKLYDRAENVASEQRYFKSREARFRDTSESTNTRVLWFSLIQISILVLTALWQITHLKTFFKKKKLV